MNIITNCPVPGWYKKQGAFQELMKQDAYKDYSEDNIISALGMFVKRYPKYGNDFIPGTPQERAVFTRYLRYQLIKDDLTKTDIDLSREAVLGIYETIYDAFTPEQLSARVHQLVIAFDDVLTGIEIKDKTGRSRQELLVSLGDEKQNGYSKIMEAIFAHYEERYGSLDEIKSRFLKAKGSATKEELDKLEYIYQEYQTILLHKERLAALAAQKIGEIEGFQVKINDDMTVSLSPITGEEIDEHGDDTAQEDGTDVDEGQKGERYVDFRLFKLLDTLGPRARRLISRIKRTDAYGREVRDDLGQSKYLDQRQVAVSLSRVLRYSTPLTLMRDLEAAKETYPWISSVIEKLNSDNKAKITLFTAFKKAGLTYIYTVKEDYEYVSRVANSRARGRSLMREAGTNLRSGFTQDEERSIYNDDGSLKSLTRLYELQEEFSALKEKVQKEIGLVKMVKGDTPFTNTTRKWEKLTGAPAMQLYLEEPQNKDLPATIAGFVRGLGFSISAQDIIDASLQEISNESFLRYGGRQAAAKEHIGRNKLYWLLEYIDGALNQAIITAERAKPGEKNGFTFYTSCDDELSGITDMLALTRYDEIEERFLNEGKSMSALHNPNLLSDIMDGLTNKTGLSEEDYHQYLEDNYLKYEGYTATDEISKPDPLSASGETIIVKERRLTGWLKWLYEGNFHKVDIRSMMKVATSSGFNHKDYARLTRKQKITSSLLNYMDSSRLFAKGSKKIPFRLAEIPIQGDYGSAYQFIYAPQLDRGVFYDKSTKRYGENSELIDALVDEVRCELERIVAIEERVEKDPDGINRPKLSTYEREGAKFLIFPEFNTNGFRETYTSLSASEAEQFLRKSIVQQLMKIRKADIAVIEDSGVLANSLLKSHGLYAEDGKVSSLSKEAQNEINDFIFFDFYTRLQAVKIFDGGLQQFNGIVDFEKRNMLLHAPRSPLYTSAVWNGELVGREHQYSIYLGDEVSASTAFKSIEDSLMELRRKGYITKRQYDSMLDSYRNITSTDGAGFRTLDSYRAVRIMSDNWDDRHERAYIRIKQGKPTKGDIDLFMEGLKLVTTGPEFINAAEGENQKPIKLTVLHKYSEQVLLPLELAKYCTGANSVPLQAMTKIEQKLKAQGKTVDLFIFGSGVKVGGHTIINPFTRWGELSQEEKEKRGYKDQLDDERILKTADDIADYVVSQVNEKPWALHKTRFADTGVAASTTPHGTEDAIAQSSQLEKSIWADIDPDDELIFAEQKIKSSIARKLYYDYKTAEIVEQFQSIREFFRSPAKLAKVLEEELGSKAYYSSELPYAIKALKDGTFALPLFSPGIEHPVQQLLASIIKKRMTKIKGKGSNLMVASGLGVEMDVSAYQGGLPDSYKLGVSFDKNGGVWFDAAVPLPDSFKEFANENGVITPEMLWGYNDENGKHIPGLVEKGIIPEDALKCLAARNPADYTHSAIPVKIKWFRSNIEGAGAIIAKEAMVTTGQDFDGDKLRFNFKEWERAWDEDMLSMDYDELVESASERGEEIKYRDYISWRKWATSDANPNKGNYRIIKLVEYDSSPEANPLEQSQKARHNAKIDLMLAQLTSRAGTRRLLIAGGCEDTKVYAKSIYLLKQFKNKELMEKLAEVLKRDKDYGGMGMTASAVESMLKNENSFYNGLCNLSDKQLSTLMREATAEVSPYTFGHSIDAFDTIVGGKEMISVYAVYNSTFQLLQRLNLSYSPMITEKGAKRTVNLLGREIGKLFDLTTNGDKHEQVLRTLALAHLVNAAVDNNKDPLLGYINQTKEMAPMTCFLAAAGYTEEEIHLLLNQPAIIELGNRMKGRQDNEFGNVIETLIAEFKENNNLSDEFWKSIDGVKQITKSHLIENIQHTYSNPGDSAVQQLQLLYLFQHLNVAAKNLSDFIKLVRPETNSGAIGSTVAGIITKKIKLDKFREKLEKQSDSQLRISGMREVLKEREYVDGWKAQVTMDNIQSDLREVSSLTNLMMDTSLDMFGYYFPQAKEDWYNRIFDIASMYDYDSLPDNLIERIANEMILWKLLKNKNFVQGNPQEEQRRMLVEVPHDLSVLKDRIRNAKANPGSDKEAEKFIGNIFLENLGVSEPRADKNPRIMFSLNGPAIENMADRIRYDWNMMLRSSDDSIRKLALDLFKYNLYTNGFGYGMYEFSHFAPLSVIIRTPGYVDALFDIQKNADWLSEDEFNNFKNQYIRNHWGDDKLLRRVKVEVVSTANGNSYKFPENFEPPFNGYIIGNVDKGDGKYTQILLEFIDGVPRIATKLGVRGRNGQITLQYNPDEKDYNDVKPVVPGNESSWGTLESTASYKDVSAEANLSDTKNADTREYTEEEYRNLEKRAILSSMKIRGAVSTTDKINKAGETANARNSKVIDGKITKNLPSGSIFTWAKTSQNGFEVSTRADQPGVVGDSRFSAMKATFNPGTIMFGHDVGGRTIESVYQHGVKQGDWVTNSNSKTGAPRSNEIITGSTTDDSYLQGYLPLWQEWASQNPELMDELRKKAEGKVLTDIFQSASTTVSQARALADILNSSLEEPEDTVNIGGLTDVFNVSLTQERLDQIEQEQGEMPEELQGDEFLSIAREDEKGNVVIDKISPSPYNIAKARRQRVQVELNSFLRDLLRKHGVATGVLTEAEARMRVNGITDFDTAEVLANGMVELIRLREGYRGEEALPEEFAHLALAMLGTDNPNVVRLLNVLSDNQDALEEAFEGQYEEYVQAYSDDRNRLIVEAAGKLVAKQMLYEQEIKTYPIRGLIRRVIQAIKDFFGRFNRDEIQKAIFDSNRIANGLARQLLGGKILDDKTLKDIKMSGQLIQKANKIREDISKQEDILNKILRIETKKLSLLETRIGYNRAELETNPQLISARAAVNSLRESIKEHKTEAAIVGYLADGLNYIVDLNKQLQEKVDGQYPVNQVCKSLSMTRDNLFAYSSVIQSIRDAIAKGEIQGTKAITDAIAPLEAELGNFYTYYNKIGMYYLSEMLSGVYGKDGLLIDIGKERGRRITIEEMCQMADRDISFMSRWFNSVADNNDYVLKAMDLIIKNAKDDARDKTRELEVRIIKALDDFERATGSRDQSWMFARDENGHKTGTYITITDSRNLSKAHQDFYDEMMAIKKEADNLVPDDYVEDLKIVMLRKYAFDKVKESDGIKNKAISMWEGVRDSVLDMSDDIDFDEYKVRVDFSGSKIDMLPLKYLAKGKNESYDDMSDDVASSVLAYVGMANEYNALNGVIGILENAKYMASRRDVGKTVGVRQMVEEIQTEDIEYKRPFRVKQARTKIQELIEDLMQMQVYGHLQSNEGTFGRTRVSKRKAVNFVQRVTSLSQMALNLPQRITNVTVGGSQILVQAAGGSSYNVKNVAWASGIYMKESADRLAETGKLDYKNKLSLWLDYFDVHQNNSGEYKNTRLGGKRGSRVFNSHLLFAGLTMGEDYLGAVTALSLAKNVAVIDSNGNPSNMWDAYEVKYLDPAAQTGAYLALKEGYTKPDGSPITKEDERAFKRSVIGTNFDLQGIYNENDRSAIQQYVGGALLIMYRKWIAPALKRRYGKTQYSTLQGSFEEGYYRTLWNLLSKSFTDAKEEVSQQESLNTIERIVETIKGMLNAYRMNYGILTDYERSNMKKAWTELGIVLGLWIASGLLLRLPPDKHDDDFIGWAENFGLAQLLRLRTELGSQAPTPLFVREGVRILKSPFAAIGPIQSTLNAFQLLLPHNYLTKIRSGRYKGHSRAYKYFREFPIISMFKKVENAIDPSSMLQYYKNDTTMWTPEE